MNNLSIFHGCQIWYTAPTGPPRYRRWGGGPIEAASLPVVLNTGDQLIIQAGKVQPGQTVAITGALGSVGRTAVWVAKLQPSK